MLSPPLIISIKLKCQYIKLNQDFFYLNVYTGRIRNNGCCWLDKIYGLILACVASVSSRKLGQNQKRGMKGEEGKEGNSCSQTDNFENLCLSTNTASDWCSTGVGVD